MTMSPPSPTRRLITADELLTLPKKDELYELVRGELRVMSPAGGRHGQIGMKLGILLGHFVMTNQLGVVVNADTGFLLKRDPDTVRAPDVGFLSAARVPPTGIPDGYIDGPPDLAVEVISPTDTLYEVDDKIAEYLAAGTRLAWVINPRRRTVAVHAPGAPVHVLGEADTLDAGDVVPGFRCAVREFME